MQEKARSAREAAASRLVERLRARDETAVVDLLEMYGSRIHQLAFRYVKNQEDAEEVTQDVAMKVFQKIEAFRGDAALSSWIHRITFNTAMSRLRRTRAARMAEQTDVSIGGVGLGEDVANGPRQIDPADWSALADEQLLRRQLRERFAEAVDELPSIYRTPVILRDLHGLSTEEASRRLKVKDQTLKSRLHRGRLLLRQRLEAFAGGLALHRPVEAF